MNSDTRSDFWSRRRAAVEAEAETEVRDAEADARAAVDERLEARPDAEFLAELDLPEPEDMDSPEQVQSLLKAAVPQRLKTRALRRLWRLNPVLANVDGLVDYGGDFTDAALVVENMQTIYQVGKGMFDKAVEAAEAEARAAEKTQAEHARAELALADVAQTISHREYEAPDQVRGADAPGSGLPAEDEADTAPGPAAAAEPRIAETTPKAPRRMRFHFETAT